MYVNKLTFCIQFIDKDNSSLIILNILNLFQTIPEKLDGVLAAKRPCQRYSLAEKKYQKSQEFQDLLKKYKPLFQYLEENSGAKIQSFDDAQYLYNTLWIEDLKNFT